MTPSSLIADIMSEVEARILSGQLEKGDTEELVKLALKMASEDPDSDAFQNGFDQGQEEIVKQLREALKTDDIKASVELVIDGDW